MNQSILNRIAADKELQKNLSKVSHYSVDQFANDAKAWISAINDGRMCCIVESVSKSGMSRIMSYKSFEKSGSKVNKRGYYRNYYAFMLALGYTRAGNGFRIVGCGMDMNFATFYNIAHQLHRLGFVSKSKLGSISQNTPTIL